MCRPATCNQCGKATWKGCGAHVDQVMGGVPETQRCRCRTAGAVGAGRAAGADKPRRRWFGR